jgi:hypothetical protein
MTRWLMLGLTIIGIVVIFTTKNAGVLLLGLLFGIVGFVGFIMALAADRVSASARPESAMAAIDDLAALRKPRAASAPRPVAAVQIAAAKTVVEFPASHPVAAPPPATVAGEMRMPDPSE